MTVVYQYKAGKENWLEIIYSLRSLKNLRNDFALAFAGDIPPYINPDGIIHITGGNDTGRYLDANHKLFAICKDARVSDPFLLMYDDVYFNNACEVDEEGEPFSHARAAMLPEVIALGEIADTTTADELPGTGSKNWKDSLFETRKALKLRGLSTWNFETHLPRVVRKQQMLRVIHEFNLLRQPLQRWTCYYNYFLNDGHPSLPKQTSTMPLLLNDMPNLKAGFYGIVNGNSFGSEMRYERLTDVLEKKIIINHSDNGLSDVLRRYLIERFPEPSRWEMPSVLSQLQGKFQLAG